MKNWIFFLVLLCSVKIKAQYSFVDYQRGFSRVANAFKAKEDTLRKQFVKAGLSWPAKQLYIRSFKYDSELEVWVREDAKSAFQLFKTYKVCALAGTLGPKRMEGDYQVPEGFYYINAFNPKSAYHLSLGLNYPNASDLILSDAEKPGGEIFIHGSCVTVGCIPIQNNQIEELYVLASLAKQSGQDFIPVHIFPIKYTVHSSVAFLDKVAKENEEVLQFSNQLKPVFEYFEQHKKLPIISVNKKGEYSIL